MGEPIKRRPVPGEAPNLGSWRVPRRASGCPGPGSHQTTQVSAKEIPPALLRKACAPISAPCALPEDTGVQDKATKQAVAALVLVTQVVDME